MIETPATPIPEERTELITFAVQPSVSPSSPSPSKPNVDDMTSSGGLEPKSGKPAPKTKTQDGTNRKSSVGPGGAWLFGDQSESTTEKDKTSKKTGGLDDKSETFGDVNTTPSSKNSSEDRKASLTNVAVSLPQENDKSAPKNTDNGNARNEAEETSQDKVSSWLLGNDKKKDPVKNTTHEDEVNGKKMGDKGSKDNDSGTGISGSDNTKVDEVNGKKMDGKGNKKKASGNNNTNTDEANGKKMDDKGGKDNHSADSGTEKSLNDAGIGSDNTKVKDELTKNDNIAKDDDTEREDDDGRNIEMIHEEDEDNDEDDDYDEEEDEDDRDEGKEGDATGAGGSHNGTKKNRARGRRKKLGYGKLKWNAASKVDTGSSGYAPRKSVKKIPNFKNSYSHVQSRFSTVSEGNSIEKTTEQQPSPPRKRSVTINKTPQADYSNVRPRLYNGATRRYNSEMPSTVPAKGYLSIHKERPVK